MPLIILLLTIGGNTTSHQVSSFSYNYDARVRSLDYVEGGAKHHVDDIGPSNMAGWNLAFLTDKVFASKFD